MSLELWQAKLQTRIFCPTAPKAGESLGVAIYHNAYRRRLIETLADTYERVFKWLGAPAFEEFALEFIESHPSEHYSLNGYGVDFPGWLERKVQPLAAQLAQIDWAMHVCFTGEDADPLSPLELGELGDSDWEHVVFDAVPTACIIQTTEQAFTRWTAIEKANNFFEIDENPSIARDLQETPLVLLVWRKSLSPMMRPLDPDQALATRSLLDGKSFSAICDQLSKSWSGEEGAERRAGELLSQWLMDGVIKSHHLGQ